MGLLSRLLGRTDELKELCGDRSHPEYPYLRVGYSPSSRYPAGDFTPWIARRLASRRFNDIAWLLVQLTSANPGMGIGTSPDYWKNHWTQVAIDICNLDLQKCIVCDDEKAFLDLHAALFPYVLHGALNGFALVDPHIDFLVRTMSPYTFSVRDVEAKVDAANKFIRKMRRELKDTNSNVWSEYPLLTSDDISEISSLKPPAYDLRKALREVSVGARQMFFGTLKDGTGQGHWIARPFGIGEDRAGTELVNCGLGNFESDPALVLTTYRNEELLKALAGHPTKQGWKKNYIIKYMTQNAPDIVANLTKGKQVFAINPEVKSEGLELVGWLERTKIHLQLAIGFTNVIVKRQ